MRNFFVFQPQFSINKGPCPNESLHVQSGGRLAFPFILFLNMKYTIALLLLLALTCAVTRIA